MTNLVHMEPLPQGKIPLAAPAIRVRGELLLIVNFYEPDEIIAAPCTTGGQDRMFMRHPATIMTRLDDSIAVLELDNGRCTTLHGATQEVWEILGLGPTTKSAIMRDWDQRFDNHEDIEPYLTQAITQLAEYGLIVYRHGRKTPSTQSLRTRWGY